MAFSLLHWRTTGRDFARGEPPPRGSVEYCGVPEVFQPPARVAAPDPSPTSSGNTPPDVLGIKIWKISAAELDVARKWVATLTRSADYARRVHGDEILSATDVARLADFLKRWKKFTDKVETWSLVDRAREVNKKIFEKLLDESRRLHALFAGKGMSTVPVPHVTDLVLTLRTLPPTLTASEISTRLEQAARWGQEIIDQSRTTGEWIMKYHVYATSVGLLGPAGLLFARKIPTYWDRDRRGLAEAVDEARGSARKIQQISDPKTSFSKGEPVYDELVKRISKIYVEAAGLAGVQETRTSAAAEAVDAGAGQVERGTSGLAWLLGAAGVTWLAARWMDSRNRDSRNSPAEDEGEGSDGDVVVLEPGDVVMHPEQDGGAREEYVSDESEET